MHLWLMYKYLIKYCNVVTLILFCTYLWLNEQLVKVIFILVHVVSCALNEVIDLRYFCNEREDYYFDLTIPQYCIDVLLK